VTAGTRGLWQSPHTDDGSISGNAATTKIERGTTAGDDAFKYRSRNNAIFVALKYAAINDIFASAINLERPRAHKTILINVA